MINTHAHAHAHMHFMQPYGYLRISHYIPLFATFCSWTPLKTFAERHNIRRGSTLATLSPTMSPANTTRWTVPWCQSRLEWGGLGNHPKMAKLWRWGSGTCGTKLRCAFLAYGRVLSQNSHFQHFLERLEWLDLQAPACVSRYITVKSLKYHGSTWLFNSSPWYRWPILIDGLPIKKRWIFPWQTGNVITRWYQLRSWSRKQDWRGSPRAIHKKNHGLLVETLQKISFMALIPDPWCWNIKTYITIVNGMVYGTYNYGLWYL